MAESHLVARVDSLQLQSGVLDFVGSAYFQGSPVSAYGQIATFLKLGAREDSIKVRLGTIRSSALSTTETMGEEGVDYSFAGVTSSAHTGIPMVRLPLGRWEATLHSVQGDYADDAHDLSVIDHEIWNISDERIVGSRSNNNKWEILALPVVGRPALDAYFHEVKCAVNSHDELFVEGYFVPRGRDIASWGDIQFSLTLAVKGSTEITERVVRTFPLATASRNDASLRSGEAWRDQSKGYFATPRYEGLELGLLAEGVYELFVTARIGDDVQSVQLTKNLKIVHGPGPWKKPTVGVIGSCVTRDNFSSAVVKRWRSDFALQGANYQMSIVSLMSKAVEFDSTLFEDMERHSFETTRRDFSKEYLDEIARDKPKYLLIDAFADARFGVVEFAGSWVTDNSWKIGVSDQYKEMTNARRSSMSRDSMEFVRLFRSACEQLQEFLIEFSSGTTVLLVAAREVERFRGLERTGRFNRSSSAPLNDAWEILDEIVLDVFGCQKIDPMDGEILADSGHPWGQGPVHYEGRYYNNFRTSFLEILGYSPHIELEDRDWV